MKCKRKSGGAKSKAKGSSKDMYAKGGIMSYKKGGKLKDACWEGYKAVGLKKKGKKTVPNCVPKKS